MKNVENENADVVGSVNGKGIFDRPTSDHAEATGW